VEWESWIGGGDWGLGGLKLESLRFSHNPRLRSKAAAALVDFPAGKFFTPISFKGNSISADN